MDQNGNPSNLEEAIETVIDFFNLQITSLISQFDYSEEKFLALAHHSGGQFIRNSWYLWWFENHTYKEWPKEKPQLVQFFNDLKIYHADDMSGIIFTSTYRTLKNKPIKLEEQVQHYLDYWKKNGFDNGIPKMGL